MFTDRADAGRQFTELLVERVRLFYDDFTQTSDDEVVRLLDRARDG